MKKLSFLLCLILTLGVLFGCSKNTGTVGELADDDAIYTVSFNYIRPSVKDDDIEGYCKEYNFKQITKNDDNTYTFRQDRAAYEEKMADRKAKLIGYLEEMLANDDFGQFVLSYELDAENDFRNVTITVDSEKYLEATDYSDLIGEYILSVYQYFMEDSDPEPGCTVEFISASTGKVLNTLEFPLATSGPLSLQ